MSALCGQATPTTLIVPTNHTGGSMKKRGTNVCNIPRINVPLLSTDLNARTTVRRRVLKVCNSDIHEHIKHILSFGQALGSNFGFKTGLN